MKSAKSSKTKKSGSQPASMGVDSAMYRMMTKAMAGNTRVRNVVALAPVLPLSECAAKYGIAVSDPWHPAAVGACVPSGNPRPSFKVNTVKRFNMVIGEGGVGFILLMPCINNSQHVVITTTADYAGVGDELPLFQNVSGANLFVDGVTAFDNTTAPFSAAQLHAVNAEEGLTPVANGRIVSCGLSATYAGTVMDMGGTISILSRASHQSVLTQNGTPGTLTSLVLKPSAVQAYREARVSTVRPTKYTLVDAARMDLEDDYSGNTRLQQTVSDNEDQAGTQYPFSQGQMALSDAYWAKVGPPANVILVTGGVRGSSYICELVMHLEYNGPGAQYSLTPVHTDPVGFGMVREASSALPGLQAGSPESSPSTLMLGALKQAAAHLGPAAMRAGGAMISAALSGGSRASVATAGAYGMIGH